MSESLHSSNQLVSSFLKWLIPYSVHFPPIYYSPPSAALILQPRLALHREQRSGSIPASPPAYTTFLLTFTLPPSSYSGKLYARILFLFISGFNVAIWSLTSDSKYKIPFLSWSTWYQQPPHRQEHNLFMSWINLIKYYFRLSWVYTKYMSHRLVTVRILQVLLQVRA